MKCTKKVLGEIQSKSLMQYYEVLFATLFSLTLRTMYIPMTFPMCKGLQCCVHKELVVSRAKTDG